MVYISIQLLVCFHGSNKCLKQRNTCHFMGQMFFGFFYIGVVAKLILISVLMELSIMLASANRPSATTGAYGWRCGLVRSFISDLSCVWSLCNRAGSSLAFDASQPRGCFRLCWRFLMGSVLLVYIYLLVKFLFMWNQTFVHLEWIL